MTQYRYIDYGYAGDSAGITRGLISKITKPSVLEGGALSPATSSSLTPAFTIDPFCVVFDTGYIIGEDQTTTVEIPNPSVVHYYTIVYTHSDIGMLNGTAAEISLLEDRLVTEYADSVVLGWLLYDGSSSQPSEGMLWESPRGIYQGDANCGYRDIIFPPDSPLTLDITSTALRTGSAGIMMDQQIVSSGVIFGPAAPDNYFAEVPAAFTVTTPELYNLALVSGQTFNLYLSGPSYGAFTESVGITTANFGSLAGVSAVGLASGLNANFIHCSADVVSVSGDYYVRISTTGAGSNFTMATQSGIAHYAMLSALGVPMGAQYTGGSQIDPLYTVYTAYSGASYTFTNTTQFNLKYAPNLYEWRFTVPNDAGSPVFNVTKAHVSVNGVMYPDADLQKMEVVNQQSPATHTLGYKLRFLDTDFFEDYLGGVISIYIEATLDATSSEVKLVNYYNALYETAYPMNACTYYEAVNCGVAGGTPTVHSVT